MRKKGMQLLCLKFHDDHILWQKWKVYISFDLLNIHQKQKNKRVYICSAYIFRKTGPRLLNQLGIKEPFKDRQGWLNKRSRREQFIAAHNNDLIDCNESKIYFQISRLLRYNAHIVSYLKDCCTWLDKNVFNSSNIKAVPVSLH